MREPRGQVDVKGKGEMEIRLVKADMEQSSEIEV